MAYIWELPGWNSGAKVQRSCWERGDYICRLDNGMWRNRTRFTPFTDIMEAVMHYLDWELLAEPPAEAEAEVFEWMCQTISGGWYIADQLMTEAEAAEYFDESREYRKTGRSFRVKVPVTGEGDSK